MTAFRPVPLIFFPPITCYFFDQRLTLIKRIKLTNYSNSASIQLPTRTSDTSSTKVKCVTN